MDNEHIYYHGDGRRKKKQSGPWRPQKGLEMVIWHLLTLSCHNNKKVRISCTHYESVKIFHQVRLTIALMT